MEYCQGCQDNQERVFNNHVMDNINRVIRENRFVSVAPYALFVVAHIDDKSLSL